MSEISVQSLVAGDSGAVCSVLIIDDFYILLDCGWDAAFDVSKLKQLQKIAPRIGAVLISHPDLLHLGALPYAMAHFGLKAPVYATLPVWKMGKMFCYDAVLSKQAGEEFDLFTLDDVDRAFESVVQLKYSQSAHLSHQSGVRVIPFAAGHMVGGAFWRIIKDPESIVYCVDHNHRQENHLGGGALVSMENTSLLISDLPQGPNVGAKRRDERFFEVIEPCIAAGGNILLPVDAAGRVLELLVTLDGAYPRLKSKSSTLSIAFLSHNGYSTIESAKSQIEWLSPAVAELLNNSQINVFAFKHVQICSTKEDIARLARPVIVLATNQDLDTGFARDIFMEMAPHPNNLVLFTDTPRPGSVGRAIFGKPESVTFKLHQQVPLEGAELREFEDRHRRIAERETRRKHKEAVMREAQSEVGGDEMELDGGPRTTGMYSFSKGRYPMYDHAERHVIYDAYGEIIDTSVYVRDDEVTLGLSAMTQATSNQLSRTESAGEITVRATKSVSTDVKVNIASVVDFVDFSGKSDVDSFKSILSQIHPQRVVLVRNISTKDELRHFFKSKLNVEAIVARIGDTINVSSEAKTRKVALSVDFLASLNLQELGDHSVAYFDAQITNLDAFLHPLPPASSAVEEEANLPQLLPAAGEGHETVVIGDVRLADLKDILIKSGYKAEFVHGVLVVNDAILIRKYGPQQMSVDGMLSDELFHVRQIVYSQHRFI